MQVAPHSQATIPGCGLMNGPSGMLMTPMRTKTTTQATAPRRMLYMVSRGVSHRATYTSPVTMRTKAVTVCARLKGRGGRRRRVA